MIQFYGIVLSGIVYCANSSVLLKRKSEGGIFSPNEIQQPTQKSHWRI